MRSVIAAVAIVTVFGALPATAQPAAPRAGFPVQVDVFATDARGRTVDDLTLADFDVREDGAPQTLEGVRFVRVRPGVEPAAPVVVRSLADERRAATPDEARLFAIFLDEYHVSAGVSTDRVREALTRFVDENVTARDLIVVMKPLDSLFTIRFTGDRDAARQAIHGFEGRKGEYEPRNAYERNYIAGTPARIEAARNQVAWSAINALAVHMGGLTDRRKTLIVVSEGIAAAERRRGQEYLPTRDTVIRSANRSNVAIYAVDPRLPVSTDAAGDALRTVAADTDGDAIAADLDAGLQRAAAHSSAYYLLRYRSAHDDDGKFHAVQVLVKRNGVRLRARKGFTAPSPDEMLRAALVKQMTEPKPAAPIEPAPHVSPLIRPWFGVSRGPSGTSRVTFVWEPAVRVPGDAGARRSPARLVLTALTADGAVLFDGPVLATGPAVIDEPGATRARAVFDAPPGRLRLRMSIQDVTAQVLDVDVRDFSVRELKGDVAVGTPEVLRARNAREFRTLDTESAVPVASREFSRTERLLVRFQAYGPTGAQPQVSARLLSRMGQAMRDLAVAPAAAGDAEHAIDLSLAGLATGDYIIEVEAKGPAGDVKDRVGFRVTP
jgi:VWFA-related protein